MGADKIIKLLNYKLKYWIIEHYMYPWIESVSMNCWHTTSNQRRKLFLVSFHIVTDSQATISHVLINIIELYIIAAIKITCIFSTEEKWEELNVWSQLYMFI